MTLESSIGSGFASGCEPPSRPGGAPGIGGRLRERPEDFLVEEIPLYEPSGEGEHLYLFVQKRSMSTLELVGALARHFGVPKRDVGYAGLKDKRAITRQVISVRLPGRSVEDIPMIRDERIAVLWVDKHQNKLRRGHLKANRFSIRVRGVALPDVLKAQQTLARLAAKGVPNRIGPQRFGMFGDNHVVGRAIVLGRWDEALRALLGPHADHPDSQREARAAYVSGEFGRAGEAMPRSMRVERSALRALAKGASAEEALRSVDRAALSFYVTAFQSAVFNEVLTDREAGRGVDALVEGDVAFMHASRRTFGVGPEETADPETEGRLGRCEISPSGPMWGTSMRQASGEIGEIERAALARSGVTEEAIERFGARGGSIEGARRPFRVPLTDPDVEAGADEHGTYVRCGFELPRGAFATTVMREVMGPETAEEGPDG